MFYGFKDTALNRYITENFQDLVTYGFYSKVNLSPFHHEHYYLCIFFIFLTHPYDQVQNWRLLKHKLT